VEQAIEKVLDQPGALARGATFGLDPEVEGPSRVERFTGPDDCDTDI
jgi:hypothetical protein